MSCMLLELRSVVSAVCESVLSFCKPILFADARNQIVAGYCVLTWSGLVNSSNQKS